MRKLGTSAIHRCRHEGDGIGREGCIWKIFHAAGSLEFQGRFAQSSHQSNQARRKGCRLPIQIGPDPFTNLPADCRAMGADGLIAILVRGISHAISNSRQRKKFAVVQRRAVTRRASRIFEPSPAIRRQEAAMLGQTCVAQFSKGARIWRRFPLASAAVSPASTLGAGKATTATPRSMTTARAEKDLNIWGRRLWLVSTPPRLGVPSNNNQTAKWFRWCNFCLWGVWKTGIPSVYRNPPWSTFRTRTAADGWATKCRKARCLPWVKLGSRNWLKSLPVHP
jgi:hypothetical protein